MIRISFIKNRSDALTLLTAALPSALIFSTIPPVWNFIDPISMLTSSFDTLIPHYAPLYIFFLRGITVFTGLTDIGIYVILFLQRLLLVGAVYYGALFFHTWSKRIIFILFIHFDLSLLVVTQGISRKLFF